MEEEEEKTGDQKGWTPGVFGPESARVIKEADNCSELVRVELYLCVTPEQPVRIKATTIPSLQQELCQKNNNKVSSVPDDGV